MTQPVVVEIAGVGPLEAWMVEMETITAATATWMPTMRTHLSTRSTVTMDLFCVSTTTSPSTSPFRASPPNTRGTTTATMLCARME